MPEGVGSTHGTCPPTTTTARAWLPWPAARRGPALTQTDIDQRVFTLYDEHCHGRLDRRGLLGRTEAARRAARRSSTACRTTKQHGVPHEAHVYPGTQHGVHHISTSRYPQAAAKPAWERTVAHLRKHPS